MNTAYKQEHEVTITGATAGLRLDQALANVLEQYSRTAIKTWIEAGQALLNGVRTRPRTIVQDGDHIVLIAELTASVALPAQPVTYELVHADPYFIVINKPAGLVVHPGAGNLDRTLVNGLLHDYPELAALPRAGLVHRIDKDTSGLLLCARTPDAYQRLVAAMAERAIRRRYEAVATGELITGASIDQPIARDPRQRTRMCVAAGGRQAVTHFRIRQRFRAHTLLELELETGRTHQIRVHMAHIGHPLVGDARYGARPRPPRGATTALKACLETFPRQALHAESLLFNHPHTDKALSFSAPRPGDLVGLVSVLEADFQAHYEALDSD